MAAQSVINDGRKKAQQDLTAVMQTSAFCQLGYANSGLCILQIAHLAACVLSTIHDACLYRIPELGLQVDGK